MKNSGSQRGMSANAVAIYTLNKSHAEHTPNVDSSVTTSVLLTALTPVKRSVAYNKLKPTYFFKPSNTVHCKLYLGQLLANHC